MTHSYLQTKQDERWSLQMCPSFPVKHITITVLHTDTEWDLSSLYVCLFGLWMKLWMDFHATIFLARDDSWASFLASVVFALEPFDHIWYNPICQALNSRMTGCRDMVIWLFQDGCWLPSWIDWTGNSTIWSAVPKNPILEPTWIGSDDPTLRYRYSKFCKWEEVGWSVVGCLSIYTVSG